MSQQQPSPSLEQYPGYFPAAKPPFWTRTKVGAVAGVLGLFFGIGAGAASGSETAQKQPVPAASPTTPQVDVQAKVDDAVAAAETKRNDELAAAKAAAKAAARQRVGDVRTQAATAQRRAVARAVA